MDKFRRLSQNNAALKAKLEFIQSKYDFTSNVKGLSTDDFKALITSNDVVSKNYALGKILINVLGEWNCERFYSKVGLS